MITFGIGVVVEIGVIVGVGAIVVVVVVGVIVGVVLGTLSSASIVVWELLPSLDFDATVFILMAENRSN